MPQADGREAGQGLGEPINAARLPDALRVPLLTPQTASAFAARLIGQGSPAR
jgi:hypothetical protein